MSADDELDRKAILARRRRFMALALTGLAGTTLTATACPCLKVAAPPDEPEPAPSTSDSEGDAERSHDRQDDGDPPEEAQPGD